LLYLPNSNLTFLHIPRTGGTFIKYAIKQLGIQHEVIGPSHLDWEEVKIRREEGIKCFTFVRSPPDLIRSYWGHRMLVGWGGDLTIAHACESIDFNKFVKRVITLHPGFIGELITRYIGEPEDENRPIIGYYENLVGDLQTILEEAGERVDANLLRSIKPINVIPTHLKLQAKYKLYVYKQFCFSEKSIMEQLGYEQDSIRQRRKRLPTMA